MANIVFVDKERDLWPLDNSEEADRRQKISSVRSGQTLTWIIVYHFWSFQTLLDNFIVSEMFPFNELNLTKRLKTGFSLELNQTKLDFCFDIKMRI